MDEDRDKTVAKMVPSPISKELAAWSREFRTRWFRRKHELPHDRRVIAASAGAFMYLFIAAWVVAGTDPFVGRILDSDRFQSYIFVLISCVFLVLGFAAYFLGRLVVSQDKDGGPVRAFLGGVALPALVVVIASTSLWIFRSPEGG